MKAIYQSPKTEIITISVSQMIAASLKQNTDGTITQDLSNPEETEATSGNLGRRRSAWDDEDWDDEDY